MFGHWRITIHYARILAGTDRLKDKSSLQGPVWPPREFSQLQKEGHSLKLSSGFLWCCLHFENRLEWVNIRNRVAFIRIFYLIEAKKTFNVLMQKMVKFLMQI